jgi:hypothetical protein
LHQLWNDCETRVFPAVRYGKLEWIKDPSYNWWRKVVKKVAL